MMKRRYAAIAAAILLCASPALAQDKKPPLRTGVDGTFAPHAMPKLGGGVEGFQIDVFTEVAKRMKRDITIDAVSFSTLIPGMAAGRYDFIVCGAGPAGCALAGRLAKAAMDLGIPVWLQSPVKQLLVEHDGVVHWRSQYHLKPLEF